MTVTILKGDCREVLCKLPAGSVHCVVTSPPYLGLRDYGTAIWEGGDPSCNHFRCEIANSSDSPSVRKSTLNCGPERALKTTAIAQAAKALYCKECAKCGAIRIDGQLGLEPMPDAYIAVMVEIFREVRRVLRKDGTLWLVLGDSYGTVGGTGQRPKNLIGIPWRVAFALQADGWYLRQDIIWSKSNPMPESVTDRCTKAHEYLFLLSKSERYYYDAEAIAENGTGRCAGNAGHVKGAGNDDPFFRTREGFAAVADKEWHTRNKRSVWEVATQPFSEAHFATFPPALIEPCILAGCPKGGTVLDPFGGAGTTGLVADRLQRNAILIELNPQYAAMAERRIKDDAPLFTQLELQLDPARCPSLRSASDGAR